MSPGWRGIDVGWNRSRPKSLNRASSRASAACTCTKNRSSIGPPFETELPSAYPHEWAAPYTTAVVHGGLPGRETRPVDVDFAVAVRSGAPLVARTTQGGHRVHRGRQRGRSAALDRRDGLHVRLPAHRLKAVSRTIGSCALPGETA